MDTLQAAILLAKLEIFPREVAQRQAAGRRSTGLFWNQAHGEVLPPEIAADRTSVYTQYTVQGARP